MIHWIRAGGTVAAFMLFGTLCSAAGGMSLESASALGALFGGGAVLPVWMFVAWRDDSGAHWASASLGWLGLDK